MPDEPDRLARIEFGISAMAGDIARLADHVEAQNHRLDKSEAAVQALKDVNREALATQKERESWESKREQWQGAQARQVKWLLSAVIGASTVILTIINLLTR